MTTTKLSPSEKNLLLLLNVPSSVTITRRSSREFDLDLTGSLPRRGGFVNGNWAPGAVRVVNTSAWMPLFLLHAFWESGLYNYAATIEYSTSGTNTGDWSFVRDADPEDIWSNFLVFARCLSKVRAEDRSLIALPDMPA